MTGPVVVLAGGTGGAKLARGMLDAVGDDLVVVANTGDDVEIYGAYVSPDPDLVTFWLADRIDERGWGLAGDTFAVMEGLRDLGVEVWFNLGDRDLAIGLERARRLDAGERLTEVHAAITASLGVRARVLPMSDRPVRTWVRAMGRVWPFQEFMIRGAARGPIEDVDLRGARAAAPSEEVLAAIAAARAIIIGPSNPIASIGPILALPGLGNALTASPAPVVAVSPFVRGAVLKGPTQEFMAASGLSSDANGVAVAYHGLIDGLVSDERTDGIPVLETDMLMADAGGRRRLAEETLRFAEALG
ncbi:MAG TPA: 2-phospho-L-lactate transferase [Solirubrobacteraceae bacterium]|nr:2-phospho-L-lactate transferase [Solirubrobacteraceae bacterium]